MKVNLPVMQGKWFWQNDDVPEEVVDAGKQLQHEESSQGYFAALKARGKMWKLISVYKGVWQLANA